MRESEYQAKLIKKIRELLIGCMIIKMPSNYIQGIPDLLILHKNQWALLEVKISADAPKQPNQDYYVNMGKQMSYAAFIFPENEAEVLDELQRTLEPRRQTRVSKS